MNCRNAERWILESLDRDLAPGPRRDLEAHLQACPDCRALRAEFVALRGDLGRLPMPALRPGFAGRVGARIEALANPAAAAPAVLWRTWCLRAIPVSLFLIGLFVGGLVFLPGANAGLSQTEALLLNETNPLAETSAFFDETKKPEENTMSILFAAAETTAQRRPRP
jgi:anti-sigma factor RsiW